MSTQLALYPQPVAADKPVIDLRPDEPAGYPWRLYVDGIEVGVGDEAEGRALAEELRADDDKARFVRDTA